jgi:hypothetical protein
MAGNQNNVSEWSDIIVLSVLFRFTDYDYPFNLVSSNSSYDFKLNSEMVTIFDILKAHRTKHQRGIPT